MKSRDIRRPYFQDYAQDVVENGYSVLPVLPSTKQPRYQRWQTACYKHTDLGFLAKHRQNFPNDGVGIACGTKVLVIDIDVEDEVLADKICKIARAELGDTSLVRVGRAPRRALFYRPKDRIVTRRFGQIDILSHGRFIVGFGIHPVTGKPYSWLSGDPSNTPLEKLPIVGSSEIDEFLAIIAQMVGRARNDDRSHDPHAALSRVTPSNYVHSDSQGRVTDGREAFLTRIVAREYAKGCKNPEKLARRAWDFFVAGADISRPKGSNPNRRWTYEDALTKARAICRKAPNLKRPRARKGHHPAAGLHGHHRRGYWSDEAKDMHQAAAERRITTPSVLIVNKAMLDATSFDEGRCVATIPDLRARTGLADRTVKAARAQLVGLYLWVAAQGVYVPIALDPLDASQVDEKQEPIKTGVQTETPASLVPKSIHVAEKPEENMPQVQKVAHPLYRRGVAKGMEGDGWRVGDADVDPVVPSAETPRVVVQLDMFSTPILDLATHRGSHSGRLSPDLIEAIGVVCRCLRINHDQLAAQIGVSRPQLTNALAGRFGLSALPFRKLRRWLEEVSSELRPEGRIASPSH